MCDISNQSLNKNTLIDFERCFWKIYVCFHFQSRFCLLLKIRLIQHLHRFRNSQSEFSKTWGGASWWWGGQWSVGCGFSSLSSSSSSSLGVTWSDIRCQDQDQLASSENHGTKPVECLESKIRLCESWRKMKKLVFCEMLVYSRNSTTSVFFRNNSLDIFEYSLYALFAMGSHVLPHIARFNKSFLANLTNLTLWTWNRQLKI